MRILDSEVPCSTRLLRDLELIRDGFVEHLRQQHYTERAIHRHQLRLTRAAQALAQRGRSICDLCRNDVRVVIRRFSLGRAPSTRKMARAALHAWLKFLGRFHASNSPAAWQHWLHDYSRFLEADRGLAPVSRTYYLRYAERFLRWKFPRKAAVWNQVRPEDIWRYATKLQRDGYGAKSLNNELGVLRQFLRFVHLRGRCSPMLAKAVPTFSDRGRPPRCHVTSEDERRKFLNSFDRGSADGCRDYAMALCMLELGLRCVEVVRLRLSSIDWQRMTLGVAPAKGGRGRVLPLPRHVGAALRRYVQARPASEHEILFVGTSTFVGRPVTNATVSSAMKEAYRRSGFDRWNGTHRLRHSFATRLSRCGANMKEIADLLGHRLLRTTNRYTHTQPHDLRALVRPWPE
jgi:integrase/recombinase XerD